VALYALVYALVLNPLYGLLQLCVVLAIPLLGLYNGRRGANPRLNRVMKWMFYAYYPLHLLIIGRIERHIEEAPRDLLSRIASVCADGQHAERRNAAPVSRCAVSAMCGQRKCLAIM